MNCPDDPSTPPAIPGFELIRPIGRGGMGEVFLARQLSLDRLVAIKLLHPVYQALSDERMVRFRREAALMARVNHPNVLTVFDSGTVAGRPYLVMEFAEGGDLRRLMRPGVPVPEDQARRVLEPVGSALACLHRHGILHRDLKPENVLLGDDGRPKVADFGIAVLRGGAGALTGTGIGLGTPGYIAPEQQYRLKVDERADQYSLAALAYELLSGLVPLGVPRRASAINPRLPSAIDEVFFRALADDPDDRFPDVPSFLQALDHAFSRPTTPPLRRRAALTAIGSAMAVVLVVVVLLLTRSSRQARPSPWKRVPDAPSTETEEPKRPDRETLQGPDPTREIDPLVPFLEDQLERFARSSSGTGLPAFTTEPSREDWQAAIDALLAHGPLADRIREWIGTKSYFIWKENGQPEGTSAQDWLEARRRFFESDDLDSLIRQLVAEEAETLWQHKGRPEQEDFNNWVQARHRLIDDGRLLPSRIRDDLGVTFVLIPAGELVVPPPEGKAGAGVTLTIDRPFYLADREVTVGLFSRFVRQTEYRTNAEVEDRAVDFGPGNGEEPLNPDTDWRNPGYPGGPADDHPVVQVTWADAVAFSREMGERLGAPYRLPTAAEWRFARHLARLRFHGQGEFPENLENRAWFLENSGRRAHQVASKRPDGLGLYDLLGNAAEWCSDNCEVIPPDAPPESGHLALGGSWINTVEQLRPGVRVCYPERFHAPTVGFRLCRDLPDIR